VALCTTAGGRSCTSRGSCAGGLACGRRGQESLRATGEIHDLAIRDRPRCIARRLRGLLRNPERTAEDFEEVVDTHEAGAPPDAVAQQEQDAARLRAAIARLPLAQREAFLLRAEGGLDVAQIALVVGCPAETAKTRLRYAYSRLRDALGSKP